MKKILIFLAIVVFATPGFSQDYSTKGKSRDAIKEMVEELAEENQEIPVLKNKVDSLLQELNSLPDSIPLVVGGDTVGYFPKKDAVIVIDEINGFVKENDGNWPKTLMGIIALIFSTIAGGKFTQLIVSGKRFYSGLKPVFGSKLGVVGFISLILTSVLTVVLTRLIDGLWGFNANVFGMISGWAAYVAVFIYDRYVKPKEETIKE